ncbi:hypothetical protein ACG83_18315 [Frankia sp. R43]|uniref:hypothetical protein n=1 Tax=Frankia sp. R43 TaxID=269536 RepID=UPI0006C9F814|nr:hypothetical protein [Frankia sp. R43]KPM54009.1 hypothetical protein ACG83_18315 [Frankia sp. R43]
MSAAVERLTGLVQSEERFAIPYADLRETQVEAMNELFQERRERIRLLAFRAKEAGISEIRSRADAVGLLFPHTAYKSYPESFLSERRWDRLGRWLGTVSAHPLTPIDTSDVVDMDDWIARYEAVGHYISCSSGTTGKSAMMIASEQDMAWSRLDTVGVFAWGSGVRPERDRRMIGIAPTAAVAKNLNARDAQQAAFGDPRLEPFTLPMPPITIGQMTKMVVLRKAIADGTARPDEIADFEATSREREQTLQTAYVKAAEHVVASRADKLYLAGMWNALYLVAGMVREMGYSGSDFNPDNCIYVGGGLKRAKLPPDYQEYVYETFNIPAGRRFQMYGMQELNSGMPRCAAGGRYHVPPWVVPFVLDSDGDVLLPHESGEVQGRAAFFDLSLDGRWGGVVTGDRISLDLDPCACGNASPSVRDDITRYADLEGDDKIGCAGTVDAYVRGLS